MQKIIVTVFLLLILVVSNQLIAQPLKFKTIKELFQKSQPEDSNTKSPGYIISITSDKSNEFNFAIGAADVEQERLINHNTVFHIASLSKQITAAAVAHAILDKKITLEDSISKWFPETSKYSQDIKVKHLIYMTSGLTEYSDIPKADGHPWNTYYYYSNDDAINHSLSIKTLKFIPGSQWEYSNINFMLLAEIISKTYKTPFSNFVKERIFKPLDMNQSLINDDTTQVIYNRANAYTNRTAPVLNELNQGAKIYAGNTGKLIMIRRNSPHYGGSGVMTSMKDWEKWQREVLTAKTFGQDFKDIMLKTMRFSHNKSNDAFGLVHGSYQKFKTLWYEGSDIDGSSYSVSFPTLSLSVNCFSNDPVNSCRNRVTELLNIMFKI